MPSKDKDEDSGKIIENIEKLDLTPDLDVSKAFEKKPKADLASKNPVKATAARDNGSNKDFIWIAVIVLIAVAAGIFFYVWNSRGPSYETVTYNGFQFVKIETHWHTQWQNNGELYNLRLRFNPYEAENIPVFGELDGNFSLANTYITFDPDKEEYTYGYEALAAAELSLNLAGVFGSNLIAACTINVTGVCSSRPIVTCESTNDSVIYIKRDPEARVLLEKNCITVTGNSTELVKAVDKVLYKIYKIIK